MMGKKKMASNRRLEAWIAAFAHKVEARRMREGIRYQRDLAAKLGMPQSTLSEHLGGKLTLASVEKIASFWPDEFGECVPEYLKISYGIAGDNDRTILREIVDSLEQIQAATQSLAEMIRDYATGGDDGGSQREAADGDRDG